MVRMGIMGLGMIGQMHLSSLVKGGVAEVVAVADKVPANLSGEGAVAGNIARQGDLPLDNVTKYDNGDALLEDPNVEAVLIALPTYLHKEYILKSIAAGKHILCEKPMTLDTAEGREVLEALEGYDKVFMVGHCIRFWPAYAKAYEIVRDGAYGKVVTAHFARNSPKPVWSWENWLMDERRSGGALLDLHIHDVDFVSYLLGKPASVRAVGIRDAAEGVQHVMAAYTYDDGAVVTLDGGWLYPPTFPFRMLFRIVLEKATLDFNASGDGALHLHTVDGEDILPDVPEGDGYAVEEEYFCRCIENGERPTVVTAASSWDSLALVEKELAALE